MKARLAGAWAARRRGQGRYDKATLGAFASAWRRSGSPQCLLAYALFRRDLGKPLPRRWLAPLGAGLGQLSVASRRLALGLLAEHGPQALAGVNPAWLADAALRLPALAALHPGSRPSQTQTDLANLHLRQPEWCERFGTWAAAQRAAQGICVVGNAAQLQGSGLGQAIDAASAVVRFNQCVADSDAMADVGQRSDVWVVSPGYKGAAPAGVAWVVMTGPDMRYRLQDWSAVLPLLQAGVPVLTVPLAVWRPLVAQLQAPPSAGVLLLAWLVQLGAGWAGVRAAGIGSGVTAQGQYHRASPALRASGRHAWQREQALLTQWQAAGLVRLPMVGSAHA